MGEQRALCPVAAAIGFFSESASLLVGACDWPSHQRVWAGHKLTSIFPYLFKVLRDWVHTKFVTSGDFVDSPKWEIPLKMMSSTMGCNYPPWWKKILVMSERTYLIKHRIRLPGYIES